MGSRDQRLLVSTGAKDSNFYFIWMNLERMNNFPKLLSYVVAELEPESEAPYFQRGRTIVIEIWGFLKQAGHSSNPTLHSLAVD